MTERSNVIRYHDHDNLVQRWSKMEFVHLLKGRTAVEYPSDVAPFDSECEMFLAPESDPA